MLTSSASKLLSAFLIFTLAFYSGSQSFTSAQSGEIPVPSQPSARNTQPQSHDEAEALRLLKQSRELFDQGQLDAAISAGASALKVCEKTVRHDTLCAAAALTNLASLYLEKGDLERAETLSLRAPETPDRQLTPDQFDLAGALTKLAKSFGLKGDRVRAIRISLRALEVLEKKYGSEHTEVALLLDELGELYSQTGAFKQAEQMHKRALAIWQKVVGSEHPAVAWSMNTLGGLYRVLGNYDLAEKMHKDALAILEKKIGPKSPDVAIVLDNLGLVYQEKKDYELAKDMHERAVVIFEQTLGPTHMDIAIALSNLAGVYKNTDNYAEAERMFRRALSIEEQTLQPDDPYLAVTMGNIANVYQLQDNDAKAEPLHLRALAILEKAYGPVHLDLATELSYLAAIYLKRGEYEQAEARLKRALAIREKLLGVDHPVVADSLNRLARLYDQKGDFAQAEQLFKRALEIKEKSLGPTHPEVVLSLENLAHFYVKRGNKAGAERMYQRLLAIREEAVGPDHPSLTTILGDLAQLYESNGDYAQAEALYRRILGIRGKAVGPEHLEVAKALSSLGLMYYKKGDYISAEPLLKRALAIVEKVLEPNHRFIVAALINLSEVHIERGNYVAAEPLLNRAIEMIEKMAGPDDPELAKPLTQLAAIYGEKGDYTRAVTQLERALRIKEKVLGPNDPELAVYLSNLAVMYQSKGDYQKRNEMYERWIEIQKKGGLEDINVVNTLANVANVQILSGNYADAEKYLKLASRMTERVLGPEHPELATYQTNLGELYRRTGNYAEAEQLLNRALAIREKALGPNHPGVARCLSDLAALSNARDDIKAAIAFESRSTEIFEHNLTAILSTGSEHQKKLYMALLSGQTDAVVSLHVRRAPNDPQALRLALTTVLRRKGRVLSAMSDQIAALRGRLNPQDKALLDKLLLMRSRLAALMLNEPTQSAPAQHQAAVEKLEEEVQQFEAAVSERSSEFRALLQPVSIEALQKLIPSGAALVELVLYRPFDAKAKTAGWAYGAEHYVAYMLRREGEPSFVDLGEAAPINQAVLRLRSSLASPKSSTVKQAARALDELVMRPVRNLLGETNMVLLSPDGELNLMPFGALVDEQGRYLVENYTFNYLTSGRDLLRLETQTEPRQQPVVIANPSFDLAVTIGGQKVPERSGDRGLRSLDFKTLPIKPLPGTAQEASAIKSIMPSALVLTEVAATEAALKQVAGPRVLHIATHGFFLKDQPLRTVVASRRFEMEEAPRAVQGENPLLRSGLVLAGVTKGQSGAGEDGVLTALEVSGLDLWGTKLVVLSACETAVGDVANGEGVYGLRRALVLAGAESQLMSLWKVSDTGTRDLMINYYTRLQRGESRTEALRQVQLAMLQGKLLPSPKTTSDKQKGRRETGETADNVTVRDYRHPYYWASFIPSGNWRNLTGQE